MRSGAKAYLALSMLDGADAMDGLAGLIDCEVTPKVFINLLREYQVDPYVCSERLCFLLQGYKYKQREKNDLMSVLFGEDAQPSPRVGGDEEMTVLTLDDVEVEFSRGSYQKLIRCSLKNRAEKICISNFASPKFEGESVTGELIRWHASSLEIERLIPFFKPADIQMLAEKIMTGSAANKKPKQLKCQKAESVILAAIKSLGYDPKTLPYSGSGLSGVKSFVKQELKADLLFQKSTSFNNHWARMRKNKDLIEVSK